MFLINAKKYIGALTFSAVCVGLTPQVSASSSSLIYSEDFNYNSITEMNNAGWDTHVAGANSSLEISSDHAYSGSTSLKVTNLDNETIYALRRFNPGDSIGPQSNVKISFRVYDTNATGGGLFVDVRDRDQAQLALLGIRSEVNNQDYYYRTSWNSTPGLATHMKRTPGWHLFEFFVTPHGTYGKIDGINMSYLKAENGQWAVNTALKEIDRIAIASTWSQMGHGTYYVDDIKIEALDPAPTSNLEIDYHFLNLYAQQYLDSNIPNINNITGKYSQKQRLFANNAVVKAIQYKKYGNLQDLTTAKQYIMQDITYLQTLKWADDQDGSYWTAPLTDYALGLASWLIWDQLSQPERNLIYDQLSKEALFFARQQPGTGYIGDSEAEENAWTAEFLALMSQMFKTDARAEYWERKARTYAFHSFTINERYNAATTKTLHNDATMSNHNYHPNPEYAFVAVGLLGHGALTYKLNGESIPSEFSHRVNDVYNANQTRFHPDSFLYQNTGFPFDFGGKSDWMSDASMSTQHAFHYFSRVNPSLQPIRDKLASFQWYVHNDYLIFPKGAPVYPNHHVFINDPSQTYLNPHQMWFYSSNSALRYATNILWQDPNISVVDTHGTFPGAAPIFTEDFEYGSLGEMSTNGWITGPIVAPSYIALDSTIKRSGNKSLKIVNSNNSSPVYILRRFLHGTSIPPQTNVKVSFWLYDASPGTGGLFMDVRDEDQQQLALAGVRQDAFPGQYFFRKSWSSGNGTALPTPPRTQGWRKFEFVVSEGGTYGILDDKNIRDNLNDNASLNTQLTEMDRLAVASTWNQMGTGVFYIDDIKVLPFGK